MYNNTIKLRMMSIYGLSLRLVLYLGSGELMHHPVSMLTQMKHIRCCVTNRRMRGPAKCQHAHGDWLEGTTLLPSVRCVRPFCWVWWSTMRLQRLIQNTGVVFVNCSKFGLFVLWIEIEWTGKTGTALELRVTAHRMTWQQWYNSLTVQRRTSTNNALQRKVCVCVAVSLPCCKNCFSFYKMCDLGCVCCWLYCLFSSALVMLYSCI